ncbi:hypothetical protein BRC64_08380 [Halobacteriales archaeon QH_10_67_22]|nr:MAG: hypothetical protein BRC64_08380 [Halobacteriales archaeon QH_10_67_22]
MSATGHPTASAPPASELAGRLRESDFVRLVGATTADGLAGCGVLARTLDALECPFQVTLARLATDAARATDADLTVAVGRADATADLTVPGVERPASETVVDAAEAAGAHLDDDTLALALAGAVSTGASEALAERASEAGVERRPGVAVPGRDLADGLAHSTLVHAPFSGDREAAAAFLADHGFPTDATDLNDEGRRRLASLVAVEAVGDDEVPPRGGEAVERALRSFAGGPVGTVGGYADVLAAVARERPGTGVAAVLGHDVFGDAVAAWRDHAGRAHGTLRTADAGRYDGLFVVRADDAPVDTVARLAHAYRSPEPVTLAATDGRAAVVADGRELDATMRAAAGTVSGTAEATGTVGRARFDGPAADFVTAFREAQP